MKTATSEVPRAVAFHFLEAIRSPESGVQIWLARLDSISPDEMTELRATLDSIERTRAARFHFARGRQHYVATRGILRSLLGAALDVSPAALTFEYGSHGKPALAKIDNQATGLCFNVSHADGLAIFAMAWSRSVGIDLEAITRLGDSRNLGDLATRILSPRELSIWLGLPNDTDRHQALLRAWTRKEAYVKATGAGLFQHLQNIEVTLDAAAPQASLRISDWIVHDLSLPDDFVAALAVERVDHVW